ncbi:hypothetical protein GCM10029976_042660 [Kribbella albertanoniae]
MGLGRAAAAGLVGQPTQPARPILSREPEIGRRANQHLGVEIWAYDARTAVNRTLMRRRTAR